MGEVSGTGRFFVESLAGEVVALSAGEARHARAVLRLPAGAEVEVFDGAGSSARGVLRAVGRGGAEVEVRRRLPAAGRCRPVIELAFAAPKGRRLDWLLEKATELGAAALVPVVFARGVVRPGPGGLDRRRAVCISAAKQCGAAFLPDLHPATPLEDYLTRQRRAGAEVRVLGDAGGGRQIAQVLAGAEPGSVAVLVGPEGGLTEPERSAAVAAGFAPVTLGSLTLRIETAAVALLAAVWACACR